MTRRTDPWHPDNIKRGMEEVAQCPHCNGTGDSGEQGTENTCRACSGTGLRNKLND